MSPGHLLFAAVTTVYILVAIQLEERDSVAAHGEDYENYRKRVSMIVPIPKKG
jgi:protein-S-isoprenylcysteine O-methyltransferase Ste14